MKSVLGARQKTHRYIYCTVITFVDETKKVGFMIENLDEEKWKQKSE